MLLAKDIIGKVTVKLHIMEYYFSDHRITTLPTPCGVSHDHPKASLMRSSRHQVTPSVYGHPQVPCGIVWRPSHHNLQGVRTVLGHPSWDCLDMMSYQLAGMYRLSQDVQTSSHTSLQGCPRTS